jgi:hypothetical protein
MFSGLNFVEAGTGIGTTTWKIPMTTKYWQTLYNGFGKVTYNSLLGIHLEPMASISPFETHAALVLSKSELPPRFRLEVQVTNERSLRENSPPNPWETFWLMFNYKGTASQKTTNYFAFKPNGIELGAAYDSVGQDFIYTADFPLMVWGVRNTLVITRDLNNLTVDVNGARVLVMPLTASQWLLQEKGFIGLYTEDAASQVHNVKLTTIP